jgi:rhodanese-related sulfurtransferase
MQEISVETLKLKQEANEDFLLLDVREQFEHDICHLNAKFIPMAQVPERLDELRKDQAIVVFCKHGGRSLRVAEFLVANGFQNVSNLTGGIIAWIDKVDSSMARY